MTYFISLADPALPVFFSAVPAIPTILASVARSEPVQVAAENISSGIKVRSVNDRKMPEMDEKIFSDVI